MLLLITIIADKSTITKSEQKILKFDSKKSIWNISIIDTLQKETITKIFTYNPRCILQHIVGIRDNVQNETKIIKTHHKPQKTVGLESY